MGNQSSQLESSDDMSQRSRRVFGPSMSPTPEPEVEIDEAAPVNGQAAATLLVAGEMQQLSPTDRPSKKRKKKRRRSLDNEAASQEASVIGDGEAHTQEAAKKSRKKSQRTTQPKPKAEDEDEDEETVIEDTQPAPQTEDAEQPHPSPKRKRKRSKKNPTPDGIQEDGLVNGSDYNQLEDEPRQEDGPHIVSATMMDHHPEHAPDVLQSPSSTKKQRRRRKKAGDASSYNEQQLPVSDTVGGSPPSAQPPNVNGILKYEPRLEDDEDETSIVPSSQWQPPRRASTQSIERGQVKREPSDDNGGLDEQLHFRSAEVATATFADAVADPVAEAVRENDPESGLGWLHKRLNAPQQTPFTGTRGAQLNAVLPDLQPSQIKAEPESGTDSDSDGDSSTESDSSSSDESKSNSPSVQKFERLSRSRSRSASRAPSRSGYLADEALGLSSTARPDPYQQVPYSAPSSTGSNRSIPARLPSPSSTGSNRSRPAHVEPQPSPSHSVSSRQSGSRRSSLDMRGAAPADADAMDVDQAVLQDPSPPKNSEAKVSTLSQQNNDMQPAQHDEAIAANGDLHKVIEERAEAVINNPPANGTAMDVDQPLVEEAISSSQSKRSKEATRARKKKAIQPTQLDEADGGVDDAAMDGNAGTQVTRLKKQPRRRQSNDGPADRNVHLMANVPSSVVNDIQQPEAEPTVQNGVSDDELPLDYMPAAEGVEPDPSASQPQRPKQRQPKASLVHDTEAPNAAGASQDATIPDPTVQNEELAASPKKKGKKRGPRNAASNGFPEVEMAPANQGQAANLEPIVAENATTTHDDISGPEESASQSQPTTKRKGKKKRMLGQSKASLSLSQIEGDEDEEDFSKAFARRKGSNKNSAGGSNEPEQSEVGGSQAPSPEKPRKPKRKRRTANDASEDEMESLLAAGPSKGRKRASELSPENDENGREAKRKRLSSASKGKATGAWTQDELNSLGKVVEDFMDENSLTQHELNKLVQQVPNKAESMNKDFWDKAEQAIPQRTRKQITERARRIYHNFVARGTWTEEQKEEVHELFEMHPKKWAEIAGMINRDQKDVRDYWRNHYLVLESQIKSRWSKDEEERLRQVMEEALSKIRITRENSDQPRQRSPAKIVDDEAMVDWQQISAAMDLTRSRQQCKWKWVDMREKGLVGDDSILLPTQPRSSVGPSGNKVNGISEELANAREDYRGMDAEDKFRLIDAIKDSGAREDKHIPWRTLVDERFRTKWHRPSLRLVWYRLRQTVPNYEDQDVEANARYLVNYYHMNQMLPRYDDNQAVEQAEEQVLHYNRGKRIWKRPSEDLRAVRERQRRSSSASSLASSRFSRKVSSGILNLSDEEDMEAGPSVSRQSAELGEEQGRRGRHDVLRSDEVSVNIPGHLKGEAAKTALAQARAKAKAKAKGRRKELAQEGNRRVRSNSVAVDSESE